LIPLHCHPHWYRREDENECQPDKEGGAKEATDDDEYRHADEHYQGEGIEREKIWAREIRLVDSIVPQRGSCESIEEPARWACVVQ
jgi:hypothetical protein